VEGDVGARQFPAQDIFVPFHYRVQAGIPPPPPPASNTGEPTAAASAAVTAAAAAPAEKERDGSSTSSSAGCDLGVAVAHVAHAAATYDADKKSVVYQRYCHVYKKGELEGLLLEAGAKDGTTTGESCVAIEDSYYDMSNWCVRFCKKS